MHSYGIRILSTEASLTVRRTAQTFLRPPLPNEWTRFTVNAARVRSLSWNSDTHQMDEDTWATIALHRPALSYLIPHLRSLDWEDSGEGVTYISLFLTPELVDVTIRSATCNLYTNALMALPQLCPHLRRLRILDCVPAQNLPEQVAMTLLDGLPDLRVYEGDMIMLPYQALARLARNKLLKVAKISPRMECLPKMLVEVSGDEALFPVVSRLHAHVHELNADSLALFRLISSESLEDVALSAADPLQSVLIDHLQLLHSTPRFKKIRKLSLTFPKVRYAAPAPDPTHMELLIDNSVFAHIFPLSNLMHLEITSFYLHINDDLITSIVNHFPRLKVLLLLSNYCRARIPHVSFKSLATIAYGCPKLRKLGLAFDAVQPGLMQLPSGEPNSDLRMLLVNDSPVSNPGRVALYLSALFPNPSLSIVPDAVGPGDNRPVRQQYANTWREVQMQMPWIAQARLQERRKLFVEFVELTDDEDNDEDEDDDDQLLLG